MRGGVGGSVPFGEQQVWMLLDILLYMITHAHTHTRTHTLTHTHTLTRYEAVYSDEEVEGEGSDDEVEASGHNSGVSPFTAHTWSVAQAVVVECGDLVWCSLQ